jgi:hypothetical protein
MPAVSSQWNPARKRLPLGVTWLLVWLVFKLGNHVFDPREAGASEYTNGGKYLDGFDALR